ncbi:MAG: LUD domain-containing protein [Comamonadaceae bacterium]|nr:LUD domain-containing protein [Comamonadaceae bacterium]
MHKNKDEVADLFAQHAPARRARPSIAELHAARRARCCAGTSFSADMGITGANFLIAETGSAAHRHQRGQRPACARPCRACTSRITGIEKVVPTLEDVATLLRLLPRSATGQSISNYVSLLHRPAGARATSTAPSTLLRDPGRQRPHRRCSAASSSEMLRCIRCGACMNHCPVYQNDRRPRLRLGLSRARWARC